jgi:hypothetical protein
VRSNMACASPADSTAPSARSNRPAE